jgi:hypothetical protein
MTLQEIFDQLTFGELSQISIGGNEAGAIKETDYPRILVHINLGLTALYKRFSLKEGRLMLSLVAGRTVYPLTRQYAVSNTRSTETVRYLLDSTDVPFHDDIHKIEQVLTSAGVDLGLNNPSDPYAVSTPSHTTLRVNPEIVAMDINLPDWLKTSTLELVYRANHPKIVIGQGLFNPARVQVQLPDSYLNALLLFVASRVHTPGGMTGEFNPGNNYAMKYEAECQALVAQNLQVDRSDSGTHLFRQRGWA